MKTTELKIEYAELMPDKLHPGVLYISEKYKTATHLCICGCGNKVITPFGRYGWTKAGTQDSVTLRPSIGNFNFECKAHYFITNNKIKWL